MLKVLVILALLLYVFSLQAYAQTDKAQNAPKSDEPASAAAPVAPQNTGGPELQPVPEKHISADVRVVSTPEKDGYDRAAFWINAALAFVGCIGIGVGVCTLIYLRKQAGEMRLQRKVMVRSLRAMREQGERENKTIVLQYRPRIIVRHARALAFSEEIAQETITIGESVRGIVTFLMVNRGGSPAHVTDGDIHLLSVRVGVVGEEVEIKESTHIGISPRTLQPGEGETIQFGLDTGISNYAFYKSESPYTIFLIGTIWYRDDLGIPRQTGLHRSYDLKTKIFTPRKDNEEEYSD